MLLQTNSYVVPKERRAEHQRLLRRFRQTLARLGCEHFEVYEQVGPNWTTGESTGRYVQIMRFRDRRHQLAVQSAERADPGAQAVIAEFCNMINFPYQQQQGLFAVGFYQSALPVTMRREATRAEVEASDAAAVGEAGHEVADTPDPSAEDEPAEDEDSAHSASDEAEHADAQQEVEAEPEFDEGPVAEAEAADEEEDELDEPEIEPVAAKMAAGPADPEMTDEIEVDATEEVPATEANDADINENEKEEALAAGADEPRLDETEKPVVAASNAAETQALAMGSDNADFSKSFDLNDAVHAPAAEAAHAGRQSITGVAAADEESGIPDAAGPADENIFGDEEAEPFSTAEPAMAFHAEQLPAEVDAPAPADAGGELDETDAEHAAEPAARASGPEWAGGAEPDLSFNAGAETIEPDLESTGGEEAWDEVEPAEAVELSAEEGNIEIVYEQLPGASDEATDDEAGEGDTDEDGGFDALLSNEQLLEGFDAEDELLHGAAHKAELQTHGTAGGRNGNDTHSETGNGRHGRMR